MNLLVIRHAVAEDKKLLEDDATRRLTASGERKFKGVVRGMKKLGWRLDRVFSSPWLRAAHTAELLEPLGGGQPIETDLLTKSPRAELLALISEYAGGAEKLRAVAIVGHEPWLGELVAWLAFGDGRHGEGLVLKKGSVTWLEGSATPGGMSLRAMLPPSMLREI
ncbi:MAG: histidine phosphatase family protein [Kofleriaceae bacterium]